MASKRQFLDPIGAGCRLILLYFSEAGTKIRISDHTIQLVPNIYVESIYRRYIGDSRDDMCVLYPVIVRFIELYLIEKKKCTSDEHGPTSLTSSTHGEQQDGLFENADDDKPLIVPTLLQSTDVQTSEKCLVCLKKMANYMVKGLSCLEKTYGYDNAAFTLKYFSNLLTVGINGTYSNELLPLHLKDSMYQNLLDVTKIKNIWSNNVIIELAELFEKCFDAHKNGNHDLVDGYKAAIHVILNSRDAEFKKIVSSTDNA